MSASPKAAMPVFSYAQAAKGAKSLAPTKPSDSIGKDDAQNASAKSSEKSETTSSAPSRESRSRPRTEDNDSSSTAAEATSKLSISEVQFTDKENIPPTRRPQLRTESSQLPLSSTASPKLAADLGSPSEKDFLKKVDRTDSWEKTSQVSSGQEKGGPVEKDKMKESEDDWEKVSVPSTTAEKELKVAPLPTVNVWTARLEAQAAKKKELTTPTSPPPSSAPSSNSTKAGGADTVRKPINRDVPTRELSAGFNRTDSSSKMNSERSTTQQSRPVSQQGEKGKASTNVVDSTSWPTPENATFEDRRKSSTHEKPEISDAKPNGSKSNSKQWKVMPFVPTPKFETPLPPAAQKRGSRHNRGREGQSRGGGQSAAGGDRQEPGSMGPPPVPSKSNDQDRGRKSELQQLARASSLPTDNRRPTSRENTLASLRKPATPMKDSSAQAEEQQRFNKGESENISGPTTSTSKDQSRASSRQARPEAGLDLNSNDVFSSQTSLRNGVEPHMASNTEVDSQTQLGLGMKSLQPHPRPSAEPLGERNGPRNRDWSREKSEVREKVESWRDREPSGESTGRREKPERTRGSHRGRGAHSFTSQPNHPYTSPLPQNGFEPIKVANSGEPRSRQSSQPFVVPNSSSSSRNNPRSQSIPVMYQPYYGMSQAPLNLQTDVPAYGYQNQGQIESGIMGSMPYNTTLSSYAVMSMVVGQLEYYFSIDNLCKDMFLRKNMDSQGWVPLRVVANFKRMKALTEDKFTWSMMQYVCTQVRNVEHLALPDGEDKLRSRENWRDFVLPVTERFPAAQNDGPTSSQMNAQQYPAFAQGHHDGVMSMSPIRSPPMNGPAINGMYETQSPQTFTPIPPLDGSVAERNFTSPVFGGLQDLHRRDADSPKIQHPPIFRDRPTGQIHNSMANGHRRQPSRGFNDETTFSDEGIPDIQICVQDPTAEDGDDATTAAPASRVLSNESSTSNADKASLSMSHRLSGLRGASGSQDATRVNLQSMVFGSSDHSADVGESAPFVYKDGRQSQIPLDRPGQYFMSYPECRSASFRNRSLGVPDAMKTLYVFWSTFLVGNFNPGMYDDFKKVAEEDLAQGDETGIHYLMDYYQGALKHRSPVSETVTRDLVDYLHDEKGRDRVYKIIRLAWRDGALNLKTRQRLTNLLSQEEQASFDKGG